MSRTIADLLEERLRQLGVMRVYGAPLGGLQHVPVDDVDLAVLLADADGRLGHHDGSGRLGAALLDGPILHLSSQPGGRSPLQTVQTPEQLLDALSDPPGMTLPGVIALHLDLELDSPAPPDLVAEPLVSRVPVMTLDPSMAELRVIAVVGPGVVRASGLEGLSDMARKGGIGIVNTWGAKGVERWDSPFHFGTAGLQARDFELAGLDSADVVVTSGLDADESPVEALGSWVVQDVPPAQLGALCHRWPASRTLPERPPLYDTIATVVTPLYESDRVPLTAPRAALHLSGALPERGVVVADPGRAGFWIARTFPTSFPGSVCVPATGEAGFAAAAALVCRLEEPAVPRRVGPGRRPRRARRHLGGGPGARGVARAWGGAAALGARGVARQLGRPRRAARRRARHLGGPHRRGARRGGGHRRARARGGDAHRVVNLVRELPPGSLELERVLVSSGHRPTRGVPGGTRSR